MFFPLLVSWYGSRELFLFNFLLFTCMCFHDLWQNERQVSLIIISHGLLWVVKEVSFFTADILEGVIKKCSNITKSVYPVGSLQNSIRICKCWFLRSGENQSTQRKTSEHRREPTTNSSHIRRRRQNSNQGHNGGRRVLSPLLHPCYP